MLFETPRLDDAERRVLREGDQMRDQLGYLVREPRRWFGVLRRSLFARAIRGSNSIEGFRISLDDAKAIADGDEPMEASDTDRLANQCYRDAMTYVVALGEDPAFTYSEGLVKSLHYMMLKYDLGTSPGRYRPGFIQVIHHQTGETVYEGPDAETVPELMSALVEDLNSGDDAHVLVSAGMAHLNLVMIHPFRDGNGRIARALQTLVLAREGILAPEFSSIEEYLGREDNTLAYYNVLAEVGQGSWSPGNSPRPWIRFVLTAHHRQAATVIRRVKESERLWEELDRIRQSHHLPERVMGALYDASVGFRVRRAGYVAYADVSDNLATRDLTRIAALRLLEPIGERRGRFYVAGDPLKEAYDSVREARPPLPDPFEE